MESDLSGGWVSAVILGIVEGLTEFLPISSTGHLIVSSHLLGETSDAAKLFDVVIQLGAILAVCWHYRARLRGMLRLPANAAAADMRLAQNLIIAFLPAAVLGLLLHGTIKTHLFSPFTVALALIAGGGVILWVERGDHKRRPRFDNLDSLRRRDALVIGLAQSLALFPGVSRAGATIIGGMLWGLNRKAATEFSFLLALPTMVAASCYDLWQNAALLNPDLLASIAVGFAVSFVAALLAIRVLLRFISEHTFTVFGWYRLAFGGLILLVLYFSPSFGVE